MLVPVLLISAALVLVYAPLAFERSERRKLGYDNRDPRGQQSALSGLGKRALGAHKNGFETFAAFAVGVLLAVNARVDPQLILWSGLSFLVMRVVYIGLYLYDRPTLRSTIWCFHMAGAAALYLLSIIALW